MNPPATIQLARPWYGQEETDAVRQVLESGWVVQGPKVAAFEKAVASLHRMPRGVAVSSATAGLHLIYLALGIGPGDIVLIPSFAWPSAANTALRVGAVPIFIDVDPHTANMTGATLEEGLRRLNDRNLGPATAVVVVHEFGLPAPMAEITRIAQRANLTIIEDAACSLGAIHGGKPLGDFSQATVFSFHPRKSISTGEGGVVVTRDDRIADQIEMLRNHGQQLIEGKREFVGCGFNYRLTEIQAAIGLVQLEKLQPIIEKKRRLVSIYLKELASVHGLQLPAAPEEHTWQTFMVTLESQQLREQLMQSCLDEGIQTGPGSVAGHTGLAWGRGFVEPKDLCPVSTRLANCGLALPLHPLLEEQDVRRVAGVVRRILEQLSAKPNSRRGAQ